MDLFKAFFFSIAIMSVALMDISTTAQPTNWKYNVNDYTDDDDVMAFKRSEKSGEDEMEDYGTPARGWSRLVEYLL